MKDSSGLATIALQYSNSRSFECFAKPPIDQHGGMVTFLKPIQRKLCKVGGFYGLIVWPTTATYTHAHTRANLL